MLAPLTDDDPRTIGPFRLHGRLGAGGMGTVYLGFGADDRPAAVKVPAALLTRDPRFRARFRREVSAARLISSGSVATVLAADTESESQWLATEYIEGASLGDAVRQRGPLADRLVLGFAAGLADALVAMHAVGVVHRDLKPANILLAWDGPKVIDFGIARTTGLTEGGGSEPVSEINQTQVGELLGTLVWMAPEQLRGVPVGPPVDVFAWGACITFATTGRSPFGGGNPAEVISRIQRDPPRLDGVPATLTMIVGASLAKDPHDRPSATEILSELVHREVRTPDESDTALETVLIPWMAQPPTPAPPGAPDAADAAQPPVGSEPTGPVRPGPSTGPGPVPLGPSTGPMPVGSASGPASGPVRIGPPSGPVRVGPPSGPVRVGPPSGPVRVGPPSGPVRVGSPAAGTPSAARPPVDAAPTEVRGKPAGTQPPGTAPPHTPAAGTTRITRPATIGTGTGAGAAPAAGWSAAQAGTQVADQPTRVARAASTGADLGAAPPEHGGPALGPRRDAGDPDDGAARPGPRRRRSTPAFIALVAALVTLLAGGAAAAVVFGGGGGPADGAGVSATASAVAATTDAGAPDPNATIATSTDDTGASAEPTAPTTDHQQTSARPRATRTPGRQSTQPAAGNGEPSAEASTPPPPASPTATPVSPSPTTGTTPTNRATPSTAPTSPAAGASPASSAAP